MAAGKYETIATRLIGLYPSNVSVVSRSLRKNATGSWVHGTVFREPRHWRSRRATATVVPVDRWAVGGHRERWGRSWSAVKNRPIFLGVRIIK